MQAPWPALNKFLQSSKLALSMHLQLLLISKISHLFGVVFVWVSQKILMSSSYRKPVAPVITSITLEPLCKPSCKIACKTDWRYVISHAITLECYLCAWQILNLMYFLHIYIYMKEMFVSLQNSFDSFVNAFIGCFLFFLWKSVIYVT